jgi:hypothetical protein
MQYYPGPRRNDDEPIGGAFPGGYLFVKQVRAAVAEAGFRCEHMTEWGTVCDPCLPVAAVNVALFPNRLRSRGTAQPTEETP